MTAKTIVDAALRRPLSPMESWFALSAMTIWHTLEVEGRVDPDALREAFRLLRVEHPALAGRFVPGRSGRADGLPDLDLVVSDQTGVVLREETGPVLANHDEALAFLVLAEDGDRSRVSFAVHHAVADGRFGLYLHNRLWSHYTDLAAGSAPAIEPRPLPDSPEAMLAGRSAVRLGPGPERLLRAVPTDLPQRAEAVFTRERVRLTRGQTGQLHARARARGLTVHALIAGACAVLERSRIPAPSDTAVDISIDTPVDLRSRLDPPARIWEVTNALGSSTGVVAVRPDSDPTAVGAQLREQLREDLASGEVCRGIARFAQMLAEQQPKLPRITVTNVGAIEPVRTPSGVRVHDFRGWVEFDAGAIARYLGAAAPGDSRRTDSFYLVHTYAGRLSVEIGLLLGAESARANAVELEQLLLGVATPGKGQ